MKLQQLVIGYRNRQSILDSPRMALEYTCTPRASSTREISSPDSVDFQVNLVSTSARDRHPGLRETLLSLA